MTDFKKGDRVEWNSHGSTAVGTAVHKPSALRKKS
jgi:hypothetical protein